MNSVMKLVEHTYNKRSNNTCRACPELRGKLEEEVGAKKPSEATYTKRIALQASLEPNIRFTRGVAREIALAQSLRLAHVSQMGENKRREE
ncbi:hypothetical protein OSTOST_05934 [Ostertagia ostertagi]